MRIGEAHNRKELIEALEEARQRRLDLRRGIEGVWYENLALIAGDHFAKYDSFQGELVDDARHRDDPVRLAINQALTVVRVEYAKLLKSRPMTEVMARSDESEDLAAAKVGKSALEACEFKFKLNKFRKRATWIALCMGVASVYVGWDPMDDTDGRQRYIIDPQTNDATFDPDRVKELERMLDDGEITEVEAEEYALGDLCFDVYLPTQLLPDETKLSFEEINNLITTDQIDVDVARANWGNNTIEPDTGGALGLMERRAMTRLGVMPDRALVDVKDTTQIHTFWLKPGIYTHNRLLRNGAMVRWCNGDKIVEISTSEDGRCVFPYSDGRIPHVFFQHVPSATSIWPESMVSQIRDLNLELDKAVSQVIAVKDYMANPMWLVATQHRIKGKIRSKAGNIVRYVHVPNVPPPAPLPGVPMPAQVENLIVALRDQILEVAGQGETSRGRVPSGVRSGVAVAYLQEEDDTRLGPTTENLEDFTANMGSLVLSRLGQYYHIPRLLRLYRRDGTFDVLKFKGADLRGNTDVVPVAGSALPRSKAARQQNILDMVGMGVPIDPKKIMDMLEIGYGEPDDTDKAIQQANRENQLMLRGVQRGMLRLPTQALGATQAGEEPPAVPAAAGEYGGPPLGASAGPAENPDIQVPGVGGAPMAVGNGQGPQGPGATEGESDPFREAVSQAVPVYAWHNHSVHLQRHYSIMMDEEFERLSKTAPHIVRLFNEHTAMHEQELTRQRQEQMQMAMATRGGPSEMAGSVEGGGDQQQQNQLPPGRPDAMRDQASVQQQATQG